MNLPAQWVDQLELLPFYLGGHLRITLLALLAGISISLPLGLLATRIRTLQWPLLATASILQTIPALALLALMVPLLGRIGFLPAWIALVLYSMLPVLRNTVVGIEGVDPAVVEAARAIGMTDRQLLWHVQLPLAAPVMIAGIRIAAVWVVGIATLSTPVGAPSLGNYIFSGLQTQNFAAILVGVAASAALALALDGLIRTAQIGIERGRKTLWIVPSALTLALLLLALLPSLPRSQPEGSVVIGSKTFTEQYVLAELLKTRIQAGGFQADERAGLGSTVIFDALGAGNVDVAVDYAGTIWANQMKRSDRPERNALLTEMRQWLLHRHGIETLGALGFENAYALAMRRDQADRLEVATIQDLVELAPNLVIGGDYEFFHRPEWSELRSHYGLRFRETLSFDPTLMYPAIRSGRVDVISAFSTDGRIEAFELALLEDIGQVLPPYDAVLLLSPQAARNQPLRELLEPLIETITDDIMRRANKMVDLDGRSVTQAAAWLDSRISGE